MSSADACCQIYYNRSPPSKEQPRQMHRPSGSPGGGRYETCFLVESAKFSAYKRVSDAWWRLSHGRSEMHDGGSRWPRESANGQCEQPRGLRPGGLGAPSCRDPPRERVGRPAALSPRGKLALPTHFHPHWLGRAPVVLNRWHFRDALLRAGPPRDTQGGKQREAGPEGAGAGAGMQSSCHSCHSSQGPTRPLSSHFPAIPVPPPHLLAPGVRGFPTR